MIVVTGISGVGKTFTIRGFLSENPEFRYVRASEVLAEHGLPTRDLTVQQAARNQEVIMASISRLTVLFGSRLIVDGHAIVETVDGPVSATADVYDTLAITGIVTITDELEQLRSRRRGKPVPVRELDPLQLQMMEIAASSNWAGRIKVGFAEVKSGDLAAFAKSLEGFRRRSQ